MNRFETPRVAVIGASETGCGWAALVVSAGWPVAIYDTDSAALEVAAKAIGDRVENLVRLRRAEIGVAEDALNSMRVSRSLLQAVGDADWIIEATREEIGPRQRMVEQIEQIIRRAAVLSCSSGRYPLSELCARLTRPERVLIAHPLDPVELMPVVEIVPGPTTEADCVEDVRFWLSMLGRAPIVLRREAPGYIVGRIAAAVWRECIALLLEGVMDVEDVDRAVSVGPALAWAAAGPILERELAAGAEGTEMFLSRTLAELEERWKTLSKIEHIEPEERIRLLKMIDKAYAAHLPTLEEARAQRLVRLLQALRE